MTLTSFFGKTLLLEKLAVTTSRYAPRASNVSFGSKAAVAPGLLHVWFATESGHLPGPQHVR
jgi:hypothetical protein